MERFLLVLVVCIISFFIFFKQILDLVFWIIEKVEDIIHPPAKLTRNWETKGIVNNMWLDENQLIYFEKEEVDKSNEKLKEIDSQISGLKNEAKEYVKEVKEWEKDSTGKPTGAIFDLGFIQMEQDNQVKYKSLIETTTTDFNVRLTEIHAQLAKLTSYYGLLAHIKEECKTPEFIEKISNAMENDIAFVEARQGKKLNDMDQMGFGFVESLLKNIKNEELNTKFNERLVIINTVNHITK